MTESVMDREQWIKFAYNPGPPDLKDDTRHLLETYSKIPADEVVAHVTDIRERGFAIHPFPCIGQWRFLNLAIGRHPLYQEVLTRMKSGHEVLLDLGCAFAQDIRRLVADGVDSSKCYGADLRLEYLDLGYELFRDKDTLKTQFIEADIFDESSALKELDGKVNIINASSFFHLFSWDGQKQVGLRCVKLLSGTKDDLIVGRQVGDSTPGEYTNRTGNGTIYRHNIDSWRRLWDEIGAETGVSFSVEGELIEVTGFLPPTRATSRADNTSRFMTFTVRRID